MIDDVAPGQSFAAYLRGAPAGLVGTLTFALTGPAPSSDEEIAETTAGIAAVAGGYVRVQDAPEVEGSYLVVWDHPSLADPVTEEVRVFGTEAGLRPSTADVAALLRTRTKTQAGQYPDDFTATSTPTRDQVERLITLASDLILSGLGSMTDTDLGEACRASVRGGAKALVTTGAAMLVEQSYWPEQQGQGDQTAASLLRDLLTGDFYDRIAKAAASCRGESGGGDEEGGTGGPPTAGAWGFPQDRGGMIGHATRW